MIATDIAVFLVIVPREVGKTKVLLNNFLQLCRAVMLLFTDSKIWVRAFKYLKNVCKVYGKFSRGI
eukprot:UN00981